MTSWSGTIEAIASPDWRFEAIASNPKTSPDVLYTTGTAVVHLVLILETIHIVIHTYLADPLVIFYMQRSCIFVRTPAVILNERIDEFTGKLLLIQKAQITGIEIFALQSSYLYFQR